MKKVVTFLFTLFLLGLVAQSASAQLLQEDFNYTLGTLLKSDNAGWLAHSGSGTKSPYIIDSNLTLSGVATYPSSGKALRMRNTGEDLNYKFTTDSIDQNVGSGVLYASMLVKFDSVPYYAGGFSGDYFFHFGDHGLQSGGAWTAAMSTADFWGHLCVRKAMTADSAITFGVTKGALIAGTLPAFTDSIYYLGQTYLLVEKYDFAGGDTSASNVSLYVFKAGDDWTTEPGSPQAGPTYAAAPQFTTLLSGAQELSFIALRQGSSFNGTAFTIDGIRVSQNWSAAPMPVELTAFNANVSGKSVNLTWSTATEVNNSGFAVERKTGTGAFSQVAFVDGNGTSNAPHHYSYADAVGAGSYSYRLKQIDRDGKIQYSKSVEATVGLTPEDYVLGQNYPNPFNPTTMISFAVKADQKASMKVYNMLGQEVMTLFDGDAKANQLYHVQFNASSLASGTYFYILQADNARQVKKMVLLK